jgi:hypothetical protein
MSASAGVRRVQRAPSPGRRHLHAERVRRAAAGARSRHRVRDRHRLPRAHQGLLRVWREHRDIEPHRHLERTEVLRSRVPGCRELRRLPSDLRERSASPLRQRTLHSRAIEAGGVGRNLLSRLYGFGVYQRSDNSDSPHDALTLPSLRDGSVVIEKGQLGMRTERWFRVLVLGGAALGGGCSGTEDEETEAEPRHVGGSAGTGSGGTQAGTAGSAGALVAGGGSGAGGSEGMEGAGRGGAGGGGAGGGGAGGGGVGGGEAGTGGTAGHGFSGASADGGRSGSNGGTAGDSGGGGSAGQAAGAGGADAGAAGTAGSAGTTGVLECSGMVPADPSEPCGCPCCWVTTNCLNTEECCRGFCEAGNDGEGCCPP